MPLLYRLNTIQLKMLCLSGFELYSRWVPLNKIESRIEVLKLN